MLYSAFFAMLNRYRWLPLALLALAAPVSGQPSSLPVDSDAMPTEEPSSAAPDPETAGSEAALPGFEAYQSDRFQIQAPDGSMVTSSAGVTQILGPDTGDSPAVSTEINWLEQPPDQVFPAALDSIDANGYAVLRYTAVVVDEVTALRLWLGNLPEPLTYATYTYVGYEDETAIITSRYEEPSESLDSLIADFHGSFQALLPDAGE